MGDPAARICQRCRATLPTGATVCLYCAPRPPVDTDSPRTAGPNAKTVLLSVPEPIAEPDPTQPLAWQIDPLAVTALEPPIIAPAPSRPPPPPPPLPVRPIVDPIAATAAGPYGTRPVRLGPSPIARPVVEVSRSGRGLLIASGLFLFILVVAPWTWYRPLAFSWSVIAAPGPLIDKALPLLFAAGGLLALFVGALPVTPGGRAATALIVGLLSLICSTALHAADWRNPLVTAGIAALTAGLTLRWREPPSRAARLLVTVGAAMFLVPALVPHAGVIPVEASWRAVTAGGRGAVAPAVDLALAAIAVIALTAWWPAPRRAIAIVWAWCLLLAPIAVAVAHIAVTTDPGAAVAGAPVARLYVPIATAVWTAMLAYGAASALAPATD